MNIVYCGSSRFGIPSLNAIKNSDFHLVHIFTQPPQPSGRGQKLKPTEVAVWSAENSVPCTETDDINSPENIGKIAEAKPDLLVVIAFGQKIGEQLIALPSKKAINVHASLLPKYRGAAPVNWAIINGDTETGITIITLASRIDAGDIVAQVSSPVYPDESAEDLYNRLSEIAAPLLLETIRKFGNDSVVCLRQDTALVTRAPKLQKSDGFISFDQPAQTVHNKIRGLQPWPGAVVDYVSQQTGKCCRVTITKACVVALQDESVSAFGRLDKDLNIICLRDKLKIVEIKPAGGHLMDFQSFINGRAVRPGDLFLPVNRPL